jgi:hypothetical protein
MLLIQPQVGVSGLRGLGADPDPAVIINSDLQQYLVGLGVDMEHGMAITPDQFRSVLQGEVASICGTWSSSCGDYNALITSAVAQYTDAYQREYLRVTQGQANGTIALPIQYVPPTPIYTTPPTVLNPPTPVYVPQQPTGSVLNPPQGTNTGVTPGTVVNTQAPPPQTTTGTQQNTSVQIDDSAGNNAMLDWFKGSTQIGGADIPNIALLGVAGLGLFLLMGRK